MSKPDSVPAVENQNLLGPLLGVIGYAGMEARTGPQAILEKHEKIRRNAIQILEAASGTMVTVGNTTLSVLELLGLVYRPNSSGWTLNAEENRVLLGFAQDQLQSFSSRGKEKTELKKAA